MAGSNRASSSKKKGKDSPQPKKQVCMVCKQRMHRVSAAHLRTHGMSVERYSRLFGARPPRRYPGHPSRPRARAYEDDASTSDAGQGDASTQPDPSQADASTPRTPHDRPPGTDPTHALPAKTRSSLLQAVAEHLLDDSAWVACIADEVGERMLGGPLRQRLSALTVTMLHQRAKVHGEAMGILSGTLQELQEEWRTTQGGPNGEPTSTEELLRMVDKAAKVVRDSEEAVQRTMKLALEEQKAQAEYADGIGPTLYSGKAEKLSMPQGVSAGDRETIRGLLSIMSRAAQSDSVIDVPAGGDASTDPTGHPGGGGGGTPRGGEGDDASTQQPVNDPEGSGRGGPGDPRRAPNLNGNPGDLNGNPGAGDLKGNPLKGDPGNPSPQDSDDASTTHSTTDPQESQENEGGTPGAPPKSQGDSEASEEGGSTQHVRRKAAARKRKNKGGRPKDIKESQPARKRVHRRGKKDEDVGEPPPIDVEPGATPKKARARKKGVVPSPDGKKTTKKKKLVKKTKTKKKASSKKKKKKKKG